MRGCRFRVFHGVNKKRCKGINVVKRDKVLGYVEANHDLIFEPSNLGYNLAEMMRYAENKGVKVSQLEDADRFVINKSLRSDRELY